MELLSLVDNATIIGQQTLPIASIAYDSREVAAGSLFVALRGSYADGHDYLQHARSRGAVACIIDRDIRNVEIQGYSATVVVDNSRKALAGISRKFFGEPSQHLKLVGITGTDGKTTTSYYLEHLLQSCDIRTGLIGTIGARILGEPARTSGRQTTPESYETQRILSDMREAGVEIAILETSSHALETHRVDGCRFDVGLITNITQEHLDFHGTVEDYRRAKGRLFEAVAAAKGTGGLGVAIVNADDAGAKSALQVAEGLKTLQFSMIEGNVSDVSASNIVPIGGGYRFDLMVDGCRFEAALPTVGRWNMANALAAVAVCHGLDIPVDRAVAALGTVPGVPGRMEMIDCRQPFQVIVDYAHTAVALAALLTSVRESTPGRILVLFGSAGERDTEKRGHMGEIAARLADHVVLTSEDPRYEDPDKIIDDMAKGAIQAGAAEGVDFDRLENRRSAIEHILQLARPGDSVVLAGKGHERSMIYGSEIRPWDEVSVATKVLSTLGYTAPV